MEQIVKQIKSYKKDISESSLKIYAGNILRLYKNIVYLEEGKKLKFNFLNDSEEIIKFIDNKKSLQTKKLYYATLVIVGKAFNISDENIEIYRKKMMHLKSLFDKKKNDQEKSQKQSDNWIDYKKLVNTYKYYKKLITINKIRKKEKLNDKEYKILFNFILLSLFIVDPKNNPPRRAGDYATMEIIKKPVEDKSTNYIVYKNQRNKVFIFNKYKTARKYGQQVLKVGRTLNNNLNLWFKYNKSKKYLLHHPKDPNKPLGTNLLTKNLSNIFFQKFKKKISVNLIRSITLTEIYKDMPELKSLDELSFKMSHSVNEALKSYVKKK